MREFKTSETREDFNRLRIVIICLGEVLEGIHITMPYTMAAYMVRDFLREGNNDVKVNEEVVGRLTGILASIFCAAQFLTSYGWGVFSDNFGRKYVLLMSIMSGCISAIIFGMAGNYLTAAMARLFGGIFNATGGTVKAMLADTCTNRTLPRALGYLGLAWGMGSMMGPMIGGALSYPCTIFSHFPLCEEGALFDRRPFLFPCIAAATLGMVTMLLSSCILDETLPALREQPKHGGDVQMAEMGGDVEEGARLLGKRAERMRRPSARSFLDYQDEDGSDSEASLVSEQCEDDSTVLMLTAVPPSPRPIIVPSLCGGSAASTPRHAVSSQARQGHSDQEAARPLADITNRVPDSGAASSDGCSAKGSAQYTPRASERLSIDEQTALEEQALLVDQSPAAYKEQPWYYDRQVILALASYGVVAFLFNLLDEVRPIFASAPIEDGGLAMSTHLLSWPLSFGGLSFILFVCLGYERFYKAVGGVWCTRWGMLLIVPAALLVPLATLFAHNKTAVMAQLFFAMAVNSVADTSAYSGSNVLINAAAPPGVTGAVNGAGQAISAGARAFGPFLGGLAWSLSISAGFPGHQFLVFAGLAIIAFFYQFTYALVDLPELDN
ncbi:Uncharacterized membrane protein YCR023C at N-terminal half [Coccomyxa sp. Obi]|nr:Uncharacterized membrane protein YCR023C at N-terminal half [Coccomyxa sp. Obi]